MKKRSIAGLFITAAMTFNNGVAMAAPSVDLELKTQISIYRIATASIKLRETIENILTDSSIHEKFVDLIRISQNTKGDFWANPENRRQFENIVSEIEDSNVAFFDASDLYALQVSAEFYIRHNADKYGLNADLLLAARGCVPGDGTGFNDAACHISRPEDFERQDFAQKPRNLHCC